MEHVNLPGVSDDESRTLNHLLGQLERCQTRNLLRASYYDGKRAINQLSPIIPPQYFKLGIVLGWSAKAVDVLARRCNLDGFGWPDGDLGSTGFSQVWDGNHLATEVSSGVVSSLIHGISFLVNTLGDEAAGEAAGLIHVKDAMSATGDWNPRTRSMDNLLSVIARDEDGHPCEFALYLDGVTVTAQRSRGVWSVQRSEHAWGVPVEPLVYKPRVGRPFGQSRISRPVMSIHDQALRNVIRSEGHMDVFSFPEFWLLGADEGIFKNSDGSQKASWQVMLGRIKGVPDDEDATNPRADVKQFTASSPQPHIDHLKMLASLFAGETDLPVTSLGVQAETNTTTADGSDNAERHLVAEAEGATDDWGPALRRSVTRAMAMTAGEAGIPPEWAKVAPRWRSPLYISRAAQADAGAKQLGAVPWLAETEVGLELLGLNDSQITRALAERRRMSGSAALRAITTAAAASGAPLAG